MRFVVIALMGACTFSARIDVVVDAPSGDVIDAAIDVPPAMPRYRKQLDIVDATIAGGPHLNFPFLVSWMADAEIAAHARADGHDIFFTDGTSTLPYQRVRYMANGALTAWVRIPSLTAATTLFVNYGDPTAADQQDVANTWDASFKGVWHFDEVSGVLQDATGYDHDGTALGGATVGAPGFMGGGVAFDGTNDYVEVANSATLDMTANTATFSMWARFTDPSAGRFQFLLVSSNAFAGTPDGYSWATQPDGDFYIYPWVGNINDYNSVTNPLPNDTWRHVAATFSFANKSAQITINGIQQTNAMTNTTTLWTQLASPAAWRFGGTPDDAPNYFGGSLDEIRIATTVRSSSWLLTEFRNQSAPLTSVSLGSEQAID